ncbi:MAG: hypothetical protein WA960_07210 [Tunicatimonas sp.]
MPGVPGDGRSDPTNKIERPPGNRRLIFLLITKKRAAKRATTDTKSLTFTTPCTNVATKRPVDETIYPIIQAKSPSSDTISIKN